MMRVYLRLKAFRRLFADDALVFLSWCAVFITTVFWQERIYEIDYMWETSDESSQEEPTDLVLFRFIKKIMFQGISNAILSFFSLWCIKFAFLLFFRKLGQKVKGQRNLWWFVFVSTFATLVISVAIMHYGCFSGNNDLRSLGQIICNSCVRRSQC